MKSQQQTMVCENINIDAQDGVSVYGFGGYGVT